jgi:hypothetical protein
MEPQTYQYVVAGIMRQTDLPMEFSVMISLVTNPTQFSFQYKAQSPPWDDALPKDMDILVTHGPPVCLSAPQSIFILTDLQYGHLDLGLGCPSLLREVWRVKPRLHVFGHVHWGHGRQSIFWDDCQKAYESLLERPRRGLIRDVFSHASWIDAAKVLIYGVHAVLWKWLMLGPGANSGSMMINAAQMWGNTGKIRSRAQVVYI